MKLSKKLKYRRGQKNELDIDITSLLDILVILLVFLLKSYSASELRVDLVENLSLPTSISEDFGETAVIVQVNRKQHLWVNDQPLGPLKARGQIVSNLEEKLKELKQIEEANQRSVASSETGEEERPKGRINLIFDEELSYNTIRQVMHTAASNGYPEFKFIVRSLGD